MGIYIRKSIKVGPFRFNLSKSGVGVSAGVKGLRIGTGPRGNYVHIGRHGLYYRTTIPRESHHHRQPQSDSSLGPFTLQETHGPLNEIESGDILQIVDSSSQELLQEMNKKQRKWQIWPFVTATIVCLLFTGVLLNWPILSLIAIFLFGAPLIYFVYTRDMLLKTVVLFYDFEPEMEKAYSLLHDWANHLASCAGLWHIEAEGDVYDRRYHAGASSLIRRKPTFIKMTQPPFVKTNIETVALGVGRQTMHFFPDRILIYDNNGVGAVSYSQLKIHIKPSRFIEDGTVPKDAEIVDHTWMYVNKSGTPDRRFKNNRQLPICLYDEISYTSATGLNEVVQVSRPGVAEGFKKALELLDNIVPKEMKSAT